MKYKLDDRCISLKGILGNMREIITRIWETSFDKRQSFYSNV